MQLARLGREPAQEEGALDADDHGRNRPREDDELGRHHHSAAGLEDFEKLVHMRCITRGSAPGFRPMAETSGVVKGRPMPSWTELALDCARFARKGLRLPEGESPVAVVLGSGLGSFAEALEDARSTRLNSSHSQI